MHLSHEPGLSRFIKGVIGDGYETFDIDPQRYAFAAAKKLDLVSECESIPSGVYDSWLSTTRRTWPSCSGSSSAARYGRVGTCYILAEEPDTPLWQTQRLMIRSATAGRDQPIRVQENANVVPTL